MTSKECFKCHKILPLESFYAHPRMKDGRLNKCKECNKADVFVNRLKKLEYYTAYEKKRFQDPERRDYSIKKAKKWAQEHPEAIKKMVYDYRRKNPEKYLATNKVNNAIRDGRLEKLPCSVCDNPKSQAHHHDYSKQLEVTWLCSKHHREAHFGTVD